MEFGGQVSRSFEDLGRRTGLPKGLKQNSGGEGGVAILEFGGQGGDKHFGISEGKGGLKYSCHPW